MNDTKIRMIKIVVICMSTEDIYKDGHKFD